MLHHYNYSTSLSHFLNYHQVVEQQLAEGEPTESLCEELSQEDSRCRSNSSASITHNKSFTIAAILGLNAGDHHPRDDSSSTDLNVVTLNSLYQHPSCGRLQVPVRHTSAATGPTTHYSVSHGCPQRQQQSVSRGLKHLNAATAAMQNNKKSCKSKRVRTIFTPEQLERLEAEFERQQYMVGPERLYLAHTLQLTEAQVKVWFQNRRIKWRKHHLELTHQRLAVLKQQQLLLDDTQPDIQDANSSSTTDT